MAKKLSKRQLNRQVKRLKTKVIEQGLKSKRLPVKIKELAHKRTLNSKTWANDDGSYTLEAHVGHIHYVDKHSGGLKEINNDVVDKGAFWEMRKAGYEVELPKKSNQRVKFSVKQDNIEFIIDTIDGKPIQSVDGIKTAHHQITYPEIAPGIDLELSCGYNSFRKTVVIKEMPDFFGDYLEIEFKTNSTFTKKTKKRFKEGGLHFRGARVWDSDGETLEVELDFEHNKLVKRIPREFLEDAVYPVRTDTTTSYYAGAGDGRVGYLNAADWATAQGSAAGNDTNYTETFQHIRGNLQPDAKYDVIRHFFPIDASGLPDLADIIDADFYFYATPATEKHDDDSTDLRLVQTNQASTSELVDGDYDECGDSVDDPTEGATPIALADMNADQYFHFALDATGLGWISKTGWTKLGIRAGLDCTDDQPSGRNDVNIRFSEFANTGSDPYLSVTYTVSQTLEPTGIASAEAFGSPTVSPGAVTLSPTGIASAVAFGVAVIASIIAPVGIGSGEAFGTPALQLGAVTVSPTGIGSGEAFGTSSVAMLIRPTGIASGEALGSPQINLKLEPAGITSAEVFGTATLQPGPVTVAPTGIASAEALGTAKIVHLIKPASIASAEALGSPQLNLKLEPTGIASAETFGTCQLNLTLEPTGIPSAEAFGTVQVAMVIRPTGIASAEAFGTPLLFGLTPLKITIDGNDRTASIPIWSIRITDVATKRADTASFRIETGGAFSLAELQEVIISSLSGDTRYFAGYLRKLVEIGRGPFLDYDVDCVDYSWYLEHPEALVSGEYGNESDQSVIQDFMPTCCPDLDCTTYVEAVEADVVYLKFDRVKPRKALEELVKISGADWYVDYGPGPNSDKAYLHYFDPATNSAPFSLSDSPNYATSFPYEDLREIKEAPQANKVIVVGSGDIVITRTRGSEEDYGWWLTTKLVNRNITSEAQAQALGDQLLEELATAPTYQCTVRQQGLRAGQDVTLVSSTRSIDSSFMIMEVETKFDGGGRANHTIKMGKYIPGLGDILWKSIRDAEQFVPRDHGHSGEADGGPLADAVVTTAAIADLAVDTSKLAALAVEAAKLAEAAVTATKIANAAVGSAAIANLAVGTAHIADGAILTAKIGDAQIHTAKIGGLQVTEGKIANLAVTEAKIGSAAITKAKIGNLAVDTLQIAGEAVTAAKLGPSSVTSVKIGQLQVTNAKIASLEASKITAGTITATISLQSAGTIGFVNGPTLSGTAGNLIISSAVTVQSSLQATSVRADGGLYVGEFHVITGGRAATFTAVTAGSCSLVAHGGFGFPDVRVPTTKGLVRLTAVESPAFLFLDVHDEVDPLLKEISEGEVWIAPLYKWRGKGTKLEGKPDKLLIVTSRKGYSDVRFELVSEEGAAEPSEAQDHSIEHNHERDGHRACRHQGRHRRLC